MENNNELTKLQGRVCVWAYRYLRSLETELNETDETEKNKKEFSEAYREYTRFIGNEKELSADIKEKAEEIVNACKENGFFISRFWERRLTPDIKVKYGDFSLIDCDNQQFDYSILIEDNHGNQKEFAKIQVDDENWTAFSLAGEDIEDFAVLIARVGGKTYDIGDTELLNLWDPFDRDNIIMDENNVLTVDSYTGVYNLLAFSSDNEWMKFALTAPAYTDSIRNYAFRDIAEFQSFFGGMTEEEFIDAIDVRDDAEADDDDSVRKFKNHDYKFISQVCSESVSENEICGPEWVYNELGSGLTDICVYDSSILENKEDAVKELLHAYDGFGYEEVKSIINTDDVIVCDIKNGYIGEKSLGPGPEVPSTTFETIHRWLTDEEYDDYIEEFNQTNHSTFASVYFIYNMLVLYRMCNHYNDEAVAWLKKHMDELDGSSEKVKEYVNTGKVDSDGVKEILYYRGYYTE